MFTLVFMEMVRLSSLIMLPLQKFLSKLKIMKGDIVGEVAHFVTDYKFSRGNDLV